MAKRQDQSSDNPLLAKIDEARLKMPGAPSRNAISERAGLDRGTLRQLDLRGPHASLGIPSINAIAQVLGLDPGELIAVAPRAAPADERRLTPARPQGLIPVLGNAAGAVAGAMTLGEPIDYVERPPALEYVTDAYAVFVTGESMSPQHNPGDLRFVHPHKPPRAGDSVIVQTRGEKGGVHGWIKILERQTSVAWVCRQLNPAAEVKFNAANVLDVHRVLTTAELFNK